MLRQALIVALIVPLAGTAALADGLPGTLNFRNVTTTRVNSTTGEQVQNEKSVEFGDFDEDGDLDVVIAVAHSDFNARQNKLYENIGGVMNEITTSGAIPGFAPFKVSRTAFLGFVNRRPPLIPFDSGQKKKRLAHPRGASAGCESRLDEVPAVSLRERPEVLPGLIHPRRACAPAALQTVQVRVEG